MSEVMVSLDDTVLGIVQYLLSRKDCKPHYGRVSTWVRWDYRTHIHTHTLALVAEE